MICSDFFASKAAKIHQYAVRGQSKKLSRFLAENRHVIDSIDNEMGETVLHAACRLGLRDMVLMLLVRGANINSGNRTGFTPLHVALQSGEDEIAVLLLKNGANTAIKPQNKESALHMASRHDLIQSASYLLTWCTDTVNIDDQDNVILTFASGH
jgi:ankyrin repeat protein